MKPSAEQADLDTRVFNKRLSNFDLMDCSDILKDIQGKQPVLTDEV